MADSVIVRSSKPTSPAQDSTGFEPFWRDSVVVSAIAWIGWSVGLVLTGGLGFLWFVFGLAAAAGHGWGWFAIGSGAALATLLTVSLWSMKNRHYLWGLLTIWAGPLIIVIAN